MDAGIEGFWTQFLFAIGAVCFAFMAGAAEGKGASPSSSKVLGQLLIATLMALVVVLTPVAQNDGKAFSFADLPEGNWEVIFHDLNTGHALLKDETGKTILHTRIPYGTSLPSTFVRNAGKDYPIESLPTISTQIKNEEKPPPSAEKEKQE